MRWGSIEVGEKLCRWRWGVICQKYAYHSLMPKWLNRAARARHRSRYICRDTNYRTRYPRPNALLRAVGASPDEE